jgi:hypothetical protein
MRRVGRLFVRLRGLFPLTNLGVAISAGALLAWLFFAVPRVDYVLQLVSVTAIALVLLAVLAVLPAAILVHRAFRIRSGRGDASPAVLFEAQRGYAVLLRMPSLRSIPGVELTWSWISPSGFRIELSKEGGYIVERVEALERADVEEIERRFVIEDALGLARIVLVRKERRPLKVLPFTGKLNSAPMLRSHAGGDLVSHPAGVPEGDRVDMRHYVPGDPLRLALWKVYARTGELMVRTPERAISPSWRIVAYLPSTIADEPAAAASRVALATGLFGEDWRFSADGANRIAEDLESALSLVISSRRARGTDAGDGAGLGWFLEEVGEAARTRLILFVPAVPGPWLDRVTSAMKRWSGAVTAIVATDRVIEQEKTPFLDRFLKLPEPRDPARNAEARPEELERVIATLGAAGAYVVAVERPTGRILSTGQAARRVA